MSVGTLNGHALTGASVTVPAWGAFWADVNLVEPEAFAEGARVTLSLADVSMVCTVVSGGVHEGRAAYRLVGGA